MLLHLLSFVCPNTLELSPFLLLAYHFRCYTHGFFAFVPFLYPTFLSALFLITSLRHPVVHSHFFHSLALHYFIYILFKDFQWLLIFQHPIIFPVITTRTRKRKQVSPAGRARVRLFAAGVVVMLKL